MKIKTFTFLPLFFIFSIFASVAQNKPAIIPEPVSITMKEGVFTLPAELTIEAPESAALKHTVAFLQQKLSSPTGSKVMVRMNAPDASISLKLNAANNAQIGKEGYQLTVNNNKISIVANEPAGLFYGVQTLLQLFPEQIESDTLINARWEIPNVEITDYPRFGWRGLMLDVSRHFFTKEQVKEFIDDMVQYKFNKMHWHLTDDEGWRIEIKSFPKLTEVGAWRVNKTGNFGTFSDPLPDEPKDYGGFYTQDDIREIVDYAKARFVDILPEIDVPGHSLAAIVAYPELSCTAGAEKYNVRSGEPIMDWSRGAPPIALIDNTLCPANEKVYDFLDKVIDEVAQLFPFDYIHMGGDEAPHNFWEKSPQVKELMKKEGLKTIPEVQGYFTKRVQKIVASKGKKFIGWDEILEGGLPKDAAVMSWRGMKGGIEAAKKGHEVVMSPTTFAYIDFMQGDAFVEPPVYATLLLSKAYEFEPLPEGVDPKWIKGGQANLWTEQIYNMRHAQYMTWPRGMAIAEAVWSPKGKRNFDEFFSRVEQQFKRLDLAGIKYAPSAYEPMFNVSITPDKELRVELTPEAKNVNMYYSFDYSYPDKYYPKYTEPLIVPKDAGMFRVISYKDGKPVGRMISVTTEDLNKRAGKK